MRSVGGAAGLRVEVRRSGQFTVAVLQGEISESFDGLELARRLSGDVLLDLSQIERITSFGVREWLKMLRESRCERLFLARCSEAVINQARMIRDFCGSGRMVSFFAPYVCSECGTEFSALYHAVEDRVAIDAAEPVHVPCPQCAAAGVFDDDPGTYLSIPADLLDSVESELGEVLQQLHAMDGAPIRKSVSGEETWLTFHRPLDGHRLHRVLEGLEGVVYFDLSAVPNTTDDGIERFLAGIGNLSEEVDQVRLVGCPLALLRNILDRPLDPRIGVISVKVNVTCSDPVTHRSVLVTLRAPVVEMALRRGDAPPIPCDWCSGELNFGDALHDLRRALEVCPAKRTTPAPAQRGQFTKPPATRSGTQTPAFTAAPPEVMPYIAPAPPAYQRAVPPVLAILGVLVLALMVGAAGIALGLIVATTNRTPPPAAAAIAGLPDAPLTTAATLGWAEGLPPLWAEQRFARGIDRVEIVGGSNADTPDEGLVLARRNMMRTYLERLFTEVDSGELAVISAATLTEDELDQSLTLFEAQTSRFAGPERIDGAVRRDPNSVFVVARYSQSLVDWDAVVEHYSESRYFRGITVQRTPPTLAPLVGVDNTLIIAATASWLKAAKPGDIVTGVDGEPVEDFSDFTEQLDRRWRRTGAGEWMPVQVLRDGVPTKIEFRKPQR